MLDHKIHTNSPPEFRGNDQLTSLSAWMVWSVIRARRIVSCLDCFNHVVSLPEFNILLRFPDADLEVFEDA